MEKNVAFFAYMNTNMNINRHTIVRFDAAPVNEGGGYNARTGEFTAPYAGVYHMQVHAVAAPREWVHLNLVCNGDIHFALKQTAIQRHHYVASKSGLVRLSKGSVCCVKTDDRRKKASSSFSGHLVKLIGE